MLLYTDVITNDELCSDAYDPKTVDDVVFEIDCAMITMKDGEVNIGANASAEEADEALEEGASTVINAVCPQLQPKADSTSFDKKSYLTYLKGYMKSVKKYLETNKPDRVEPFEKGAQTFAKKIVANFKDYEFYTGEGMDPEGMVVLLNYRADGTTPYLTFWRDGLKEVKL